MSKVKKIVIVFFVSFVFVISTALNTFAMTEFNITLQPATYGLLQNEDTGANSLMATSRIFNTSSFTGISAEFKSNVNQPNRIAVSIPFSLNIPTGNYWTSSFDFMIVAYDTSGNSYFTKIKELSIALGESGSSVVFRYSNSSNTGNQIPVTLPPSSLTGDLHFYIVLHDFVNFDVITVQFRFYSMKSNFGLESEFSQYNEKNETQKSGNDSLNDVSSAVPDKSAGMLSALQSLSNAVSYTGTEAKWKFPQMYIPAIAGVTDRINLNSEMEIDFSYWVNQIPQDIRTIISALATIGLVIFAFKELYGLISYVLTLKGGGNNE